MKNPFEEIRNLRKEALKTEPNSIVLKRVIEANLAELNPFPATQRRQILTAINSNFTLKPNFQDTNTEIHLTISHPDNRTTCAFDCHLFSVMQTLYDKQGCPSDSHVDFSFKGIADSLNMQFRNSVIMRIKESIRFLCEYRADFDGHFKIKNAQGIYSFNKEGQIIFLHSPTFYTGTNKPEQHGLNRIYLAPQIADNIRNKYCLYPNIPRQLFNKPQALKLYELYLKRKGQKLKDTVYFSTQDIKGYWLSIQDKNILLEDIRNAADVIINIEYILKVKLSYVYEAAGNPSDLSADRHKFIFQPLNL